MDHGGRATVMPGPRGRGSPPNKPGWFFLLVSPSCFKKKFNMVYPNLMWFFPALVVVSASIPFHSVYLKGL